MHNTTNDKVTSVSAVSEEAIVNYISSINDYNADNTQFLYEVLAIAKLTLNPLFDKNCPYNTIVRRDWDISNNDVTRARNFILDKLGLSFRM